MNLESWGGLTLWLAIEATALMALAGVAQIFMRSPRGARTVWRAALMTVALIWIVELSGARDAVPVGEANSPHRILTATVLVPKPQSHDVKHFESRLEVAAPAVAPALIRWPGWIWLLGASLVLARSLFARIWLAARRRTALPADEESSRLVEHWRKLLGLRAVQVQTWRHLRGLIAFGVFDPVIALPQDFSARFSLAEREVMLSHEMAHLAARDPAWLLVSDVVLAMAWWHPLVWWARHRLQCASESAADEASTLAPNGAQALAEVLVRLGRELTESGPARALGVSGSRPRSQLAGRVARLLSAPPAWRPLSWWSRFAPQAAAIVGALVSVALPIQTGLSGSIVAALLAVPAHAQADNPSAPAANVPPATDPVAPGLLQTPIVPVEPDALPSPQPLLSNIADNPQPIQDTAAVPLPTLPDHAPANKTLPGADTDPSPTQKLDADISTTPKPVEKASVPVKEINSTATAAAKSSAKVSLVVAFAEVPEQSADDAIGLDWIFGVSPTNNPDIETSHNLADLRTPDGKPLVLPSFCLSAPTIERFRSGQSVVLTRQQFAALQERIALQGQADILIAPACVVNAGLQAHFTDHVDRDGDKNMSCSLDTGSRARFTSQALQTILVGVNVTNFFNGMFPSLPVNSQTVVAGVNVTNSCVNYQTIDFGSGYVLDVFPTLAEGGQWNLRVAGTYSAFLGYDKITNHIVKVSTAGKPVQFELPSPHFLILETQAESALAMGDTLAIRCGTLTDTTRTKGNLFRRSKTTTTRRSLYVFITPKQPSAGGAGG